MSKWLPLKIVKTNNVGMIRHSFKDSPSQGA